MGFPRNSSGTAKWAFLINQVYMSNFDTEQLTPFISFSKCL
jgi:hypothetical protein